MRRYMALTENSENRDDFAKVLAALEADPEIVLRVSLDDVKKGGDPKSGSVEFFADAKAAERVSAKINGWKLFPVKWLRDAPDNNEPIETLGPDPSFTDHRVKQPAITAGMTEYLLVGGKSGTDFNAAAVALLKEPTVRLTGWMDHTNTANSSLSGVFSVAAKDQATVEAVARKLPRWVVIPR